MGIRDKIIGAARDYIGTREYDGNHAELVNIYNSIMPLPRGYAVSMNDDWCAVFVSAVLAKCNALQYMDAECGCYEMVELARSRGIWHKKSAGKPVDCSVADVIMYDWNSDGIADHVGFVNSVVNGQWITTVEGNRNDTVSTRNLNLYHESILGVICPNYGEALTKDDLKATQTSRYKTANRDIANRVIRGDFGNGQERRERLEKEGYSYFEVQALVNVILSQATS